MVYMKFMKCTDSIKFSKFIIAKFFDFITIRKWINQYNYKSYEFIKKL